MSVVWKLVNGLLGDPAVYAFFQTTGDAILFDLGQLDALANRDLLKVRTVCVSHTHIDHFIGFDRWLRVNIPHGRQLELCGPSGLLANVLGKLAGYCWNLLEPDQLRFVVHELSADGEVSSFRLCNQTGFRPERLALEPPSIAPIDAPLPTRPAACLTTLADGTRIQGVALDHGTPSIAYVLQGACRFYTKTEALKELGLKPGPWIRELQHFVLTQQLEHEIQINGRYFAANDLTQQLFEIKRPKLLGYVTDIGFSSTNLERATALLEGVETLICETNYCADDHAKAYAKKHLTTRQAALIAACAKVGELGTFHISNLYTDRVDAIVTEAAEHFAQLRTLSADDLRQAVAYELNLPRNGVKPLPLGMGI